MNKPTRSVVVTGIAAFALGMVVMHQDHQMFPERYATPQATQSAAPTTSPLPSPQATVTVQVPGPTTTVQVPSDACIQAGQLASDMKQAIYDLSASFGKRDRALDEATRAVGMNDQVALNKALKKIQTASDDSSGPARRVTEIEPKLDAANKACRG